MITIEQFYEYITEQQNETFKKHPELSMSKGAAIDGMLERAKREGAREAIEKIEEMLSDVNDFATDNLDLEPNERYGAEVLCVELGMKLAELKKKYEV